jgi:hypothetical protein
MFKRHQVPKPDPKQEPEWNIFARELQAILARHGFRLGHLNDRAGIHPQKVARLQRSLRDPKFNVLPPEELEHVCQVFKLDADERTRLHAAILATAIEEMLMNRVNNRTALEAADQILPIIYNLLKINVGKDTPLSQIKGGPMVIEEFDPAFETALDIIDRATIALHLSADAATPFERAEMARQARDGFAAALAMLEALPPAFQGHEVWEVWHTTALQGHDAANKRLAQAQA